MTLTRAAREWIRQRIANAAARAAVIAETSPDGRYEVEGRAGGTGEEGSDEKPYEDSAILYQHYGFRSRPAPRAACVTLPAGGASSQRIILATEMPGAGPLDQEDGEVEVYSSAGQRIRLRADGSLILQVASSSQVQLRTDGSVLLVDSAGGTAQLKNGVLTVGNDVARRHDLGTGAAPACAASAAATAASPGTTAIAVGTDRLFQVTVVVGGVNPMPINTALFTATFAASYPGTNFAQVTTNNNSDKKWRASFDQNGVTLTAAEEWPVATTVVFIISTGGVA